MGAAGVRTQATTRQRPIRNCKASNGPGPWAIRQMSWGGVGDWVGGRAGLALHQPMGPPTWWPQGRMTHSAPMGSWQMGHTSCCCCCAAAPSSSPALARTPAAAAAAAPGLRLPAAALVLRPAAPAPAPLLGPAPAASCCSCCGSSWGLLVRACSLTRYLRRGRGCEGRGGGARRWGTGAYVPCAKHVGTITCTVVVFHSMRVTPSPSPSPSPCQGPRQPLPLTPPPATPGRVRVRLQHWPSPGCAAGLRVLGESGLRGLALT